MAQASADLKGLVVAAGQRRQSAFADRVVKQRIATYHRRDATAGERRSNAISSYAADIDIGPLD